MLNLSKRNQMACTWSAIIGGIIMGIAFFPLAGFLPPHPPSANAVEIAALYQQNTFGIRLGMLLFQVGSAMAFPLLAVISIQMSRIEGAAPVLAYTQMLAGLINFFFLLFPPLIWTVAAFRPDRPPEIIQAFNDFAWLGFVMTIAPAWVQNISIAVATLQDKRATPVFPRWVAFLNLFFAVMFIADLLITFFKTGPFAWNGLISFYVPLVSFSTWMVVMIIVCRRAIRQPD